MNRKTLLFEILKIRRETTLRYQKYLSAVREYYPGEKMYMREVHVLMEIGESGLPNASELSERLGITRGAVSQYLKKLEDRGFVARIPDPEDRRQVTVRLTEKGLDLFRSHESYDREQYAKLCPIFSKFREDELELVCRFEKAFGEFTDMIEELGEAALAEWNESFDWKTLK